MTIRKMKLTILVVSLSLLAAVSLSSIFLHLRLTHYREDLEHLNDFTFDVIKLNNVVTEYLFYQEGRSREQWDIQYNRIISSFRELESTCKHLALIRHVETSVDSIKSLFEEAVNFSGNYEKQKLIASEIFLKILEIQNHSREMQDIYEEITERFVVLNDFVSVAMIISFTFVIFLLFAIITRKIISPINRFTAAVKNAASGTFSADLPVELDNEIGILARSYKNLEASREAAMQDLLKSNSEMEQFAYIASHDLKAPLRGIDNLAIWVIEDAGSSLPAESLHHLEMLQEQVLRMENLLEGLLQYSRAGSKKYDLERINIIEIIESVLVLLDCYKNVRITDNTETPETLGARVPLEMVIRNLVSNAVKHSEADDLRIEISVSEIPDFFSITISDNGIGIPQKYQQKVFEVFSVLRTRDDVEGSGLGLAMIKKAVERAGGTIRLHSEGVKGSGASFTFTWPKLE